MENKTEIEYIKINKCPDCFTESTAEYVLPDYNGDVRKILYSSVRPCPSGRFSGGDEVELSGILLYNVIYLDSENDLTSVSFTSDYDLRSKCSEEGYRDSFADVRVSSFALRLVGPRKITARASVVGSVRVAENASVAAVGTAFDGSDQPEIFCERIKIRKCISCGSVEREYAESLARLDGAIADEVSVIISDAEPRVDEITLCDGEVTLRGAITVCALIKNGSAPSYMREKIIPLEERVSFDGDAEAVFIPEIVISSLSTNVNADENGCEVVVSLIADITARGEYNEEAELICDAYLKDCVVDNRYESFAYSELQDVISVRENESGFVPRSEIEADGLREIVFVLPSARLESAVCEDGRLKVKGDIKYNGIASEVDSDGNISYIPLKLSLPFNRELDAPFCDGAGCEVRVDAGSASATFDSSKLYLSCSLGIRAVITAERSITRLLSSDARPDEPYTKDPSKIVVYYPEPSDTLFSIAKKYRTTVEKLASDNSLAREAALGEGGKLLDVERLVIY